MDESEKGRIALDAIIDEARQLGDTIKDLTTSVERFIAITGSTAGVGLTLGLLQKQRGVLIALPIALSILYIYVVQIYTDTATYAGHKRYLETVINDVTGCEIMIARTRVAIRHDRRPSPIMSSILSLLVLTGLAIVSVWAEFHYYHSGALVWLIRVAQVLLLAYCAFTVGLAIREYTTAEQDAYHAASQAQLASSLKSILRGQP